MGGTWPKIEDIEALGWTVDAQPVMQAVYHNAQRVVGWRIVATRGGERHEARGPFFETALLRLLPLLAWGGRGPRGDEERGEEAFSLLRGDAQRLLAVVVEMESSFARALPVDLEYRAAGIGDLQRSLHDSLRRVMAVLTETAQQRREETRS